MDEESNSNTENDEDKELPSRIRRTRNLPTKPRNPIIYSLATNVFKSDLAATPTGMANTSSTARSKTTQRMNVRNESKRTNRAETDKDVPTDLKCM
jgi:hypothetical protein